MNIPCSLRGVTVVQIPQVSATGKDDLSSNLYSIQLKAVCVFANSKIEDTDDNLMIFHRVKANILSVTFLWCMKPAQ